MDWIERKPEDSERAADLLENIYAAWKEGKPYEMKDALVGMNMTRWEYRRLEAMLVEGEYIEPPKGEEVLRLTTRGKEFAAELLMRHRYLKEFLQMVCNVDEAVADNDACRIEHIVSNEVLCGIRDFMKNGKIRDRIISGHDLNLIYDHGRYAFEMGIYETNVRYPRRFSKEMQSFRAEVPAAVGDESWFYLQRQAPGAGAVWYLDGEEWIRASEDAQGVAIPSSIFRYAISREIPVIEADALIAFGEADAEPEVDGIRNLNIHMW